MHTTPRIGSHYTPAVVARYIVRNCLAEQSVDGLGPAGAPLRILDPACGDGAFLREVFECLDRSQSDSKELNSGSSDRQVAGGFERSQSDRVRRRVADARIRLVREHIFGVDLDQDAILTLRRSLCERIAPVESLAEQTWQVLRNNFRVGDALTGPGFEEHKTADDSLGSPAAWQQTQLDWPEHFSWQRAFPQVAAAGGFDVIVGNPPYLRELYSKAIFDRIALSPLGRKWRQARMDLWYYFLHRGLDLLRPGGVLSFIVNSYWTASAGATKLIDRLQSESILQEIVLLGDAPLFPDVAGRHLIFRLRRRTPGISPNGEGTCRVVNIPETPAALATLLGETGTSAVIPAYEVPFHELFRHGKLILSRPEHDLQSLDHLPRLGALFEVRQGMAENPPAINSRIARLFPGQFRIGEGVFVLTETEIRQLELTESERSLLRPYYALSSYGRYALQPVPTHYILYLTRRTTPSLDDLPNVRRHLDRFRPILVQRREVRHGKIAWWHLHWPRDERLFTEPRILCRQLVKAPGFVWAEQPTFIGFSANVIVNHPDCGFDLRALTGILNSSLARCWFSRFAKRRGVNLEVSGTLLRQFPVAAPSAAVCRDLSDLVTRRQVLREETTDSADSADIQTIERTIDDLVRQLYA